MGSQKISPFEDAKNKQAFTKSILNDLKALEHLINENKFETKIQRIGAEQELGIVGKDWYPAMNYDKILKEIDDDHFTTELGRFNLEINLDPIEFTGSCFSKMQSQLEHFVQKAKKAAVKNNSHIMITGILPTINSSHLEFKNMTPNPRYKALNDMIKGNKNAGFELNIQGIDELKTYHPNILFEACNTSFQVHYQLTPKKFVKAYNWALAIAGPVLAISANSPILGGKNMAAIHLSHAVGGNFFLGFISAVAFATILAVVSGLTLAGASAISHDLYASVIKKGKADGMAEMRVSKMATVALGIETLI